MTKGIKINIRTTTAIIALKAQLNALTYTSHGDVYASETLFAGNYYIAGATTHTGILTFDAQDDPNATFVIKCGAAHAIGVGATNILINGAKASNIFYYVIGALSAGVNADVVGTFIGDAAVGIGVGCTLTGRLFTTLGAITTGNIMGLPTETDSHPFDLGIASQYVLFSISGNISNPSVITNPATITSGNVACGTGTVVNFPPYDGIYNTDESDVVMRIVFGIYNDNVLSNSSLTYVENKTAGKYYSVAMSTTIVNNGELISARIGVDSDSGTAIVTNRTLYGVRQI
jgi:hypothetical protein